MFRKDGSMVKLKEEEITLERAEKLLYEITPPDKLEEFKQRCDTDFAYALEGVGRFRANLFRDHRGIGGVFRLIPSKVLTFEDLNSPPVLKKFCLLSKGLVLVTGPTGSGKSTTLAAMIDYINETRQDHIITIEDPIEFVHQNKRCLVNQREVGEHTLSFKAALRAALREDPDIVLVGEMRDLETTHIAIETAETGHLVFGTLHTISAAATVDRIIDAFPSNQQEQIRSVLSVALKTIIAQTLVPHASGRGRRAAYEIMHNIPAVANLMREHKTNRLYSVIQTSMKLGMITMDDFLFKLFSEGNITGEVALERAHYPDELRVKMMAVGANAEPVV
jgi:twitching motility protein PilT